MKNLARLVVLGAVAAISAPFASATPFLTGQIFVQDSGGNGTTSPLGTQLVYTYSTPGVNGGVATLQDVNVSNVAPIEPAVTAGGAPVLNTFTNGIVLGLFNTSTSGDFVLWSGTNSSGDTEQFHATSFGPTSTLQTPNGDLITVVANGYFLDNSGDFLQTAGYDTITFNPPDNGGNITEDLTAQTPEPSSLILLGSGLLSAGGMLMRRRKLA